MVATYGGRPISQMSKIEILAALAKRSQNEARKNRNYKAAQIKAMHVKELARMHAAAQAKAAEERRYRRDAAGYGHAHANLAHAMRHGRVVGGF